MCPCDALLSVKPIFRFCSDFIEARERYFTARSMLFFVFVFFKDISFDSIFNFVKGINIFGRLYISDYFFKILI